MRLLATLALCPVLLLGCKEAKPDDAPAPAPASQASAETPSIEAPAIELVALTDERVEVGCAKCSYDMPGVQSCKLAAVVQGHPVLVGGAPGEEHAHSFCGGTKHAVITAEVWEGQLVATQMKVEDG